jgi:uncharacterized protein with NRDE domain
MCTVVYIPNNGNNYFASLRDESPLRSKASMPQITRANEIQFIAPIDSFANGTWIGVNDINNVIILLNGGNENHSRNKTYRKSRGLIVLELLSSELPVVDWNLMDLKDIEPFTLIIYSDDHLFQLVWDGTNKIRMLLDAAVPHIFSSSTLYTPAAKANRKQLFDNWIEENPHISKLSLLDFFNSSNDKENGFIINRSEILKTISYSFIEVQNYHTASFNYFDFIDNAFSTTDIEISKSEAHCKLLNTPNKLY